jgi:hypothetical protein
MTAEEIITKLIDEDKITGEEAVVLLKLAIAAEEKGNLTTPIDIPIPTPYPNDIVVMYGVRNIPSYDFKEWETTCTSNTSEYNPINDRTL